jgi:unsaturated rhamnogalacturonyl hydrolase
MKSRFAVLMALCLCMINLPTYALTEFDADSIVNVMKLVAKYRMTYCSVNPIANCWNHASTASHQHAINHNDKVNPWEQINGGNNWDAGAFFTGLMAMYYASKDTAYSNYIKRWADYFKWSPYVFANPPTHTSNMDNICCGATYCEYFLLEQKTENRYMIDSIGKTLAYYFDVIKPNPTTIYSGWGWCDALYMGPPTIVRYCKAANVNRFLDSLDRFWWALDGALYNKTYKLWWRDAGFTGNVVSGKPVFWSGGNGWVLAGLARTLDYMPATYSNRQRFENQFKEMSGAIRIQQGFNGVYDGLWTTNLLVHDVTPGAETSGSAFFCFAFAWGVRNKLLDSATYTPVINAAWRDLVKNVGADGRLLRCQHVDWGPADMAADANNSSPEGEGAFLLAGYEMYLRATGKTTVMPTVPAAAKIPELLSVRGGTVTLRLANPSAASLKIFSTNGRLVMDLSARIKTLQAGSKSFSLKNLGLAAGIYRIVLNDEGIISSSTVVKTW